MARSTARERPQYACTACGWQTAKWVGRCGECQAWSTVDEVAPVRLTSVAAGPVTRAARPIGEVSADEARARPTGIGELDRVLGGGLVPGGVVLLAGEPGVGKSTLLLEVAARMAGPESRALVVTGEESAAQVRARAGRVGALRDHLYLAAETDLSAVLGHVEAVDPSLLVVDSVQTISVEGASGQAGGGTQVREVAAGLIRAAKERAMTVLLVGHVTKDGAIAGPRTLEHLVDVVLGFEGDRHARLRLVRAVKNRYGPTDEVGCFDLGDGGLVELPDPSALFRSRHGAPTPGSCVTVTLEGRRPLVVEVQALVAPSAGQVPRRTSSDLDATRVAIVLAVLERRAGARLAGRDVFTATVGGVRLTEPAADLAVALATASAERDLVLPPDVVVIGEVGLAGEVRPVSGLQRRLAEAARLGYRRAFVPVQDAGRVPAGIEVVRRSTVREFVVELGDARPH